MQRVKFFLFLLFIITIALVYVTYAFTELCHLWDRFSLAIQCYWHWEGWVAEEEEQSPPVILCLHCPTLLPEGMRNHH